MYKLDEGIGKTLIMENSNLKCNAVVVSPNGRYVYFTVARSHELWRCRTSFDNVCECMCV